MKYIKGKSFHASAWWRFQFFFLVVIAYAILAGCFSAGDSKQYYQLFLQPMASPRIVANNDDGNALVPPHWDTILMVEPVEMEDIYNDYRIVYRTSNYQLNYYSRHFWIKKPHRLVRDAIFDYLDGTGYFKKVITGFVEGSPEFLLKVRVYVIEEIDLAKVWYAHLKMNMELKDFKSGEQILSHSFNRQTPLIGKKVDNLPLAISQILKEELVILLDKLPAALKEREKTSQQ